MTDKYVDIGFVTEFSGTYTTNMACKVEILLVKGTGKTVSLDCIVANKAFTAITGTPTIMV